MSGAGDARIAKVLRALARERGPGATFCPSEAARRLADDWRPLLDDVRRVAGEIGLRASQGSETVDPAYAKGPIRLGGRE